jgi:hypothetical protein
MRNSQWIIGLAALILIGCKASSVSGPAVGAYSEDLSVLRPTIKKTVAEEEVAKPVNNGKLPTAHIKAELDSVNQIIIANNKKQKYVDGFTVQIYTGNDRSKADEAVTTAELSLLNITPTIEYYQPNYKVKVGQYTDRLEAHKIFEDLKQLFPLALLIPERIPVNYE